MIGNDQASTDPPWPETHVRGWYTTYNEDGGFPNGYDDADGAPVFVVGSLEEDDAWIAVPPGIVRDLETWR